MMNDQLYEGLTQQLALLDDLYQDTVGDPNIPLVCILCYMPRDSCECVHPALYAVGVAITILRGRLEA